VDLDAGAVDEPRLEVVATVDQVGELVAEMDPVGGSAPARVASRSARWIWYWGNPKAASSGPANGVRSRVRPSSQRR
jgi:hypothetical protein